MIKDFIKEIQSDGINLIDIGCSGNLPDWKILCSSINLFGFDPNKLECERLEKRSDSYLSKFFYPKAVGNKTAKSILYKTRSIYCFSLLKPNQEFVKRFFSYKDMYEVLDQEDVETISLDECNFLNDVDVDAIKIDSQGLEGPILTGAQQALKQAFYLNIEIGFIQAYQEQKSSFSDIEPILKKYGFNLFDISNNHKIARDNIHHENYQGEQLIYSESIWLKDYVELARNNQISKNDFHRTKVLKILILCAYHKCISYGLELAQLFRDWGYISQAELAKLSNEKNWSITSNEKKHIRIIKWMIRSMLKFTPYSLRWAIKQQIGVLEIDDFQRRLKKSKTINEKNFITTS